MNWDEYFLNLAKEVSKKSIDPSTKHGCIIVDKDHRILSVGYNGPPQGIDDSKVPLTRPDKYYWFLHAEENAILFCKQPTEGSTVYITGRPCMHCLRKLVQMKIKKIIHGNLKAKCVDETDQYHANKLLSLCDIEMIEKI